MKMHKWLLVLFLTWAAGFGVPALAQSAPQESTTQIDVATEPAASSEPEMADVMRQDGKIYIVVAVLVTLLAGILIYLISLDKKIGRLERELKQ